MLLLPVAGPHPSMLGNYRQSLSKLPRRKSNAPSLDPIPGAPTPQQLMVAGTLGTQTWLSLRDFGHELWADSRMDAANDRFCAAVEERFGTERGKRTATFESVLNVWPEVNPGIPMPPIYYDRQMIELFAGDPPLTCRRR